MRLSVAEFPDETNRYPAALEAIARHVETCKPDLLVLPEMPFTPWAFHTEVFDQATWDQAVSSHAAYLDQFAREVRVPLISSRPITLDAKRLNQAFFLDETRAIRPLRCKYHLPNDHPAVEAPWFDVGDQPGEVFDLGGRRIGVQLCSEIMYAETPRIFGASGAEIIAQPRATGGSPKWRAASVLSAATAGAFVIGANRRSTERDWFSGGGWIYSPEGACLAETSADAPITSVEIDLGLCASAKADYPLTMFRRYERSEA